MSAEPQSYLYRVFRDTELLNKQTILGLLDPRPGGKLLDCGCGDGSFTAQLAARAQVAEVHGIEAIGARIEAATGRGVIVAQTDLNARFPYDDEAFDIVHSNQLIEHLHSTDGFLREVRRVLKPEGLAVLSTNNLASWHNIISLVLGMQPPPNNVSSEVVVGNRLDPLRGNAIPNREDSHLRIFSYQALKELCEHHGFQVLDLRTAGYYPLPPSLARIMTRLDRRHGAFLIIKLARR
ncbi:MAG TPA: class I SAM-dependent methyltransferase [Thermoanaerobaculia bacterium]|nr:class I SAM-dependent methyltransferase [Thermoanaerobaculia bacterium]